MIKLAVILTAVIGFLAAAAIFIDSNPDETEDFF
jgi:hypothetical protein